MEPVIPATRPLWRDTAPTDTLPRLVPLAGDLSCDVAVLGAGITGLTTALELARAGQTVVVLEARHVGSGTTGGSSAKVTLVQGTRFSGLAQHHEAAVLARYADASIAGQQYIRSVCERTGAPFDVCDGITYSTTEGGRADLADEAQAMAAAGIAPSLTDDAGLPFRTTGALRLPDQLQFDPQAYLHALLREVLTAGARVHVGTRVDGVSTGSPRELGCFTRQGRARVRAEQVVVATGTPVLDRAGYFARLEPSRSYCVAVRVPGSRPEGMYLSVESPTRSVRRAGEDLLVVGGNGHTVGQAQDNAARIADLERWARTELGATETTHRWGAQDYRTLDGLPFVGRYHPRAEDMWVATGFAKWGTTTGTAAGLAIAGEMLGRPLPWGQDWDPWRGDALAQLPTGAKLNAVVAKEAATGWSRAMRHPAPIPADVPEGTGVVGRDGVAPVGVSRVGGVARTVNVVCPHMHGILRWNDAEMSWDCPLHGSRFAADGELLEGPARCGLTAEHGR
jgi:glycine/D-amino acid oxidase-like deaminating enzyme/nitrite reductase/ring-hydroxylating ferredoxin subunit